MKKIPLQRVEKKAEEILSPFETFIESQTSTSLVLAVATVIAMVIANTGFHESYLHLIHTRFGLIIGNSEIIMDLKEWVSSGLMALFFFLLGLELKREILAGELKEGKRIGIVLMAALGGMVMPALFFLMLNFGSPTHNGWAIPLATDTAFAIGLLAFLSRRVDESLFIFLTGLAIFDDLGAIAVIAFHYTESLHLEALGTAFLYLLMLFVANITGVRGGWVYLLFGTLLWWYIHESGVHGTMAGILVAMAVPARPDIQANRFVPRINRLAKIFHKRQEKSNGVLEDKKQFELAKKIEREAMAVGTPLQRWETKLENPIGLIVLPVFALCNAGIRLADQSVIATLSSPLPLGIILGLVIGKPVGVTLFSWIALRLGLGDLPEGMTLKDILGIGLLAGMGFTMSIFIAILAFPENPEWMKQAKLGILVSTLLSACLGFAWLWWVNKDNRK